MKKILLIPILLFAILTSCRKETVTPDTGLTPAMGRDTLFYIMKEFYLWYDKPEAQAVTEVTKNNYPDPYELLDAMRYKTLDRWSFVEDYDAFIAEMSGSFVGHGIRIGLDGQGNARIAMIYSKSPLYASGVRRGWIVKKINDTYLAPILIANDAGAYSTLLGESKEGVTNKFLFTQPSGTDIEISSTKTSFTLNTVLACDTLHLNSGVTGHLVFESFITPSANELADAFAYFKALGISDLILDLRYNTGGYLSIAQTLASYIGGNTLAGYTFAKLSYNDKHPEVNSKFPFVNTSYSIGLPRLVVITTRSTASASEAVINGLKPYCTIVTVGDTTNGKPTGMNGWDVGKKYYMWPVTFKIVNSANEGDYFDGFAPSKFAVDDITHDWSDRNEACLKQAISYLETGGFVSGKTYAPFRRLPSYSEKPEWMNNMFLDMKGSK